MKKCANGVIMEMTQEEINELEKMSEDFLPEEETELEKLQKRIEYLESYLAEITKRQV